MKNNQTNKLQYMLIEAEKNGGLEYRKVIRRNTGRDNDSLYDMHFCKILNRNMALSSAFQYIMSRKVKIKNFQMPEPEKFKPRVLFERFELRQAGKLVANIWVPGGRFDYGHAYIIHYKGSFRGYTKPDKDAYGYGETKMTEKKMREWSKIILDTCVEYENSGGWEVRDIYLPHWDSFYAQSANSRLAKAITPKWLVKTKDEHPSGLRIEHDKKKWENHTD